MSCSVPCIANPNYAYLSLNWLRLMRFVTLIMRLTWESTGALSISMYVQSHARTIIDVIEPCSQRRGSNFDFCLILSLQQRVTAAKTGYVDIKCDNIINGYGHNSLTARWRLILVHRMPCLCFWPWLEPCQMADIYLNSITASTSINRIIRSA